MPYAAPAIHDGLREARQLARRTAAHAVARPRDRTSRTKDAEEIMPRKDQLAFPTCLEPRS